MTKKELIDQLNILLNKIADARADTDSLADSLAQIERQLENLPSDASEIKDDDIDEEDK